MRVCKSGPGSSNAAVPCRKLCKQRDRGLPPSTPRSQPARGQHPQLPSQSEFSPWLVLSEKQAAG